jgi:hypothetical protein
MRCSANRLLQLATKPRLQSIRSEASSHVWPSASNKISRARRAFSARSVRLLARCVSSIRSAFVKVMASVMNAIIVYKWLLQSTRPAKRFPVATNTQVYFFDPRCPWQHGTNENTNRLLPGTLLQALRLG